MWAGLSLVALATWAPAQNTPSRPRSYAVTNVALEATEDAATHTLLLRDGHVEAILPAGADLPADLWTIDGAGLIALPTFVDAWTQMAITNEGPVVDQDRPVDVGANVRTDMRVANRKGIQPAFQAASAFALEASAVEAHQAQGFGLALLAPGGQLLAGESALISVRDAAPRDLVVQSSLYQHAALSAGRGGYPGTMMAFHSQLRQFFLDAERHATLRDRWAAGKPGPRPAHDADLEVGADLLAGAPLVCEATTARDINRWLRLADELGLNIVAFAGARDAGKVADKLAAHGIAVILDLDWGDEADELEVHEPEEAAEGEEADEPEVVEVTEVISFDYREPMGVRAEKRRLWEERRDTALRLREAGVQVLFGSGEGKAGDLLENVRTLVELGFPADEARAALTSVPARFFGVDHHYGWLSEGSSATFNLWTGDPLADEAQVVWAFVDGFVSEYEVKATSSDEAPAEGLDLSGTWKVQVADEGDDRPMTLVLTMAEDGSIEGRVTTTSPLDGSELSADVSGQLSGEHVELEMTFNVASMEVEVKMRGHVDGDHMHGTSTVKLPGNEQESDFEANRQPGGAQ